MVFADRKHSPLQALEGLVGHKVPCAVGNDLEGVPVPDACLHGLHYTKVRYAPDPMEDRDLRALPTSLDGVWTDIPPPSLCRRSCAAAHTCGRTCTTCFTGTLVPRGERLAPSLPAVQYP